MDLMVADRGVRCGVCHLNRYDSRRAVRSWSVAGAYSRVRVVPSDTTLLVLVEGVYALFITAKLRLWYLCYKLHIILQ